MDPYEEWRAALRLIHDDRGKMYQCRECGDKFEWHEHCDCGFEALAATQPCWFY